MIIDDSSKSVKEILKSRGGKSMKFLLGLSAKGVSNCLGIFLILVVGIALTTISVSVIAGMVHEPAKTPHVVIGLSQSREGIIIRHEGGDSIKYSALEILVQNNTETRKFMADNLIKRDLDGNGMFDLNDEVIIPYTRLGEGFYKIRVIYLPAFLAISQFDVSANKYPSSSRFSASKVEPTFKAEITGHGYNNPSFKVVTRVRCAHDHRSSPIKISTHSGNFTVKTYSNKTYTLKTSVARTWYNKRHGFSKHCKGILYFNGKNNQS